MGRKTRLPEKHRQVLWAIFAKVQEELKSRELITHADMFNTLAGMLDDSHHPPFDFVVTDEAQDISVAQLRFLAALGAGRENSLFFAGDLGQRIFQQPFSWKSLGVDIRGRSRNLRINYRTSHQIRMQEDRLLDPEVADVDGNVEERRGTISVDRSSESFWRFYDGHWCWEFGFQFPFKTCNMPVKNTQEICRYRYGSLIKLLSAVCPLLSDILFWQVIITYSI